MATNKKLVYLHFCTYYFTNYTSTAVGQAAACAPVTQRARVRSPVGTSFLGEDFFGVFLTVRQMSGSFRPPMSPNIIWPSLSSPFIMAKKIIRKYQQIK